MCRKANCAYNGLRLTKFSLFCGDEEGEHDDVRLVEPTNVFAIRDNFFL